MSTLNLCKLHLDGSTINFEAHLEATLGEPIKLPQAIQDVLDDKWANEAEPDLLALFELMTGSQYEEKWRDNTYNSESDLDSFAVVTVYADTDCPDWCWRRDIFVAVEIGSGGDPRYSAYSSAKIYRVEDCLGDSGFLDWRLGYWAEPISERYDPAMLDAINDRLSAYYSNYPYGELESFLDSEPIWCDKRESFIARLDGIPYPVRILPHAPTYQMAHTYLRPNLTEEESKFLVQMLESELQRLDFKDPSFDCIYSLRAKILKTKPIKA